jgi:hypothetical protein
MRDTRGQALGFSNLFTLVRGRRRTGAQAEEDRMPHLAFTRPLGEFYLTYELRNKPRGRGLMFHLLIERLVVRT